MIALIIVGAILLLILTLLFSRIHIRVTYGEGGIKAVFSCFGIIHKRLYPLPERKKKIKITKKTRAEGKTKKYRAKKAKRSRLHALHELRSLIVALVERMPRTFTLRIKRFILLVGSDDAAKTALLYGAASASLSVSLQWLDRHLLTLRRSPDAPLVVSADFSRDTVTCEADLVLTTTLMRLVRIACTVLLPHLLKKRRRGRSCSESAKAKKS